MNVTAIGSVAAAALARSGGRAVPVPAFADSPYFEAAGEIVWVGAQLPAMHPRAVMTDVPPLRRHPLALDAMPVAWTAPRATVPDAACLRAAMSRLAAACAAADSPRGFGLLLAGHMPAFPLDLGVERVHALARAYAHGDAAAVYAASFELLGFGTGLTPSGDDLAGAALFGRGLVSDDARWVDVAVRLSQDITTRSHVVSAALFADLARGASFAPLHALVDALAAADDARARGHARTLARIGHSSGWDMLTGLVIGITGVLP